MARIVGYIACSLDGFIADADERLDWLDEYGSIDYGAFSFDKFAATIGTTIMGRATFDWLRRAVKTWPHPNEDTLVVTSQPLADAPARVTAWRDGIDALVAHLRALPGKDVWIAGGGKLQSAILERNAMDHLEIYVMPVLIGSGVRLWPGALRQTALGFDDVRHLERGVVRLAYNRRADA